jgi:pimeloyl-ACP methyl ester carboxylesterase
MRFALGERLAARYRVIIPDRPGHGWSDRPGGRAAASPARQAALVRQALEQLGIARAIVVGHSWSGALAAALALDHPSSVAGLVLLAPVTHPWRGGVGWYNPILTTPLLGPLFARTMAYPLGSWLIAPGVAEVFAPQRPPPNYVEQAYGDMILRPAELMANAWDVVQLKAFVTGQASRYPAIQQPTVIIAGAIDTTAPAETQAKTMAEAVPHAQLVVLAGTGHMVHYADPDRVIDAIDDIAAGRLAPANRGAA